MPPTTVPGSPSPGPALKTYIAADYDQLPLGPVSGAGFRSQFPGAPGSNGLYKDLSVIADNERGRVMGVLLKANTTHQLPSGTSNGIAFSMPLPASVDRACISYDIKFSAGFDFSLGGKLPGLSGAAPGYGVPTGGKDSSNGWSGRLMWLGPKAYRWAGPVNMGVSYLYHPGQASEYGDNIRWNKSFDAGSWYSVRQCHVMNTVGSADGVLRTWVDGQLVVDLDNFVYRTRDDVHVSQLSWHFFRGGNTINWAGATDGYVYTDNVRVTSY